MTPAARWIVVATFVLLAWLLPKGLGGTMLRRGTRQEEWRQYDPDPGGILTWVLRAVLILAGLVLAFGDRVL